MTMLQTVLQPAPEQLRALLETGPSPQSVAALLPGYAGHMTVERVHFPGSRPVQLQLRAQDDAGRGQMLWGEWVGARAADMAAAEAARLAKPRRGQQAALPSVAADPAHGLVLRRPGFDAKLPGLRLLHDAAFAAELFGPLAQVSLVAHRLGKRAVLRIAGPDGLRYARLRPISSGSGQDAYDRHHALWTALQGNGALSIPRPLGFDAELGMALFDTLPGTPPRFQQLEGFRASAAIVRAIGALQALTVPAPLHETANELAILDNWAGRVAWAFPDLAQRIDAPLGKLRRQLQSLCPQDPVLCHRDLHEGQVLLHDGRTGLLDFDTMCLGDPALDVGNLQAHLILAALRDGAPRAAFVTAIENALPKLPLSRIAIWRRAALLRLAMIYAFSAEPRDIILALIQEAA